jgi:hypothetical protein
MSSKSASSKAAPAAQSHTSAPKGIAMVELIEGARKGDASFDANKYAKMISEEGRPRRVAVIDKSLSLQSLLYC